MLQSAPLFTFPAFALLVMSFIAAHAQSCFVARAHGLGTFQSSQPANSPESCIDEINQVVIRAYREVEGSGRDVDSEKLRLRAEAIAKRCVPPATTTRVEQLPAVARLNIEAGRYSQADAALGRYLRNPSIGTAKKAEILLQCIGYALHSYSLYTAAGPERAPHAESCLKKLMALGPPFITQQIDGHAQLGKHYLSDGKGAEALRHQSEVVRLSKRLKPDERTKAVTNVISDLLMLADFKGNKEGPGRALAVLKDISPELLRLAGAEQDLLVARSRYELGGQPAPVLAPQYVLNDERGTAVSEAGRHVTVMVFAAHWCGPCRVIYPRAAEIYERFRQDGVRVLLVTRLYGYFGDRAGLKPEEELEAIREYYLGEMGLKFPILVEAQPVEEKVSASVRRDEEAAKRDQLLFGFMPQTLVIDGSGRTRAVLVGALPGQGERVRAAVEELIKESR